MRNFQDNFETRKHVSDHLSVLFMTVPLNYKDIFDNKLFWKTIKLSLFDKVMTRINLFEKGESVKTELETGDILNKFSSNIINNLEISKYSKDESFIDNTEGKTLGAILKYSKESLSLCG